MNTHISNAFKIIFLGLLALGFVMPAAGGAELSGKRVLIVAGKDRISDPMVSKVIALLENDRVSVKTTDKSDLWGVQAGSYDAVFIVNPVKRGKVERSVRVYFASERVQKKIVLFKAVGDKYWVNKRTDESGRIAESLFDKINVVLEQK